MNTFNNVSFVLLVRKNIIRENASVQLAALTICLLDLDDSFFAILTLYGPFDSPVFDYLISAFWAYIRILNEEHKDL